MKKIKGLSKIIFSLGLKKEAKDISSLDNSSVQPWLSEWRDVMRHYGFQNFGRDKKWHKGKSHLEEPLDRTSAEHDIHMVEQAHTPDSEGRRISDKSLDKFMREFYGENIWIAPREGWRSKMNKSASKDHSNPNARFTHYSKQTTLPLNWLLEIFGGDRLKQIIEYEPKDIIGDLDIVPGTGRTALDIFVDNNWEWISDMVINHGVTTENSLQYVGSGSFGVVWRLPDGELLKITKRYGTTRKDELTASNEKLRLIHGGDSFAIGDVRILKSYSINLNPRSEHYLDYEESSPPEEIHGHWNDLVAIIMNEIEPLGNIRSESGDWYDWNKQRNEFSYILTNTIELFLKKYLKDSTFRLTSDAIISDYAIDSGIIWNETERQRFEDDLFNKLQYKFSEGSRGKALADIISVNVKNLRSDWLTRFLRSVSQHVSRDQCDIHFGNMGIDIKGDMVFYDA
jgi:hypothetical protein